MPVEMRRRTAAAALAVAALSACTAASPAPLAATSANGATSTSSGPTLIDATSTETPSPTDTLTPTPTSSPTPTPTPTPTGTPTPTPTGPGPQLPGGGREIFPRYRVVAYYGNGQATSMGVLGHFTPDEAAAQVAAVAKKWSTAARPTLPAMELIVTIADGSGGPDGNYSHDSSPAIIRRYLAAARRLHELLILDIQPGRQTFLPVVKRYAEFLAQPDVGVALDPEWRMSGHDVPGRVIGHVDAAEINDVSAYLAELTAAHNLPQKILLLHHFTEKMIVHPERVVPRDGLAIVWHVDGFGGWPTKVSVYRKLHARAPFFNGFKLFYTLDRPLASPRTVLKLAPPPDFISYQ